MHSLILSRLSVLRAAAAGELERDQAPTRGPVSAGVIQGAEEADDQGVELVGPLEGHPEAGSAVQVPLDARDPVEQEPRVVIGLDAVVAPPDDERACADAVDVAPHLFGDRAVLGPAAL